jgi:hypothetical protein
MPETPGPPSVPAVVVVVLDGVEDVEAVEVAVEVAVVVVEVVALVVVDEVAVGGAVVVVEVTDACVYVAVGFDFRLHSGLAQLQAVSPVAPAWARVEVVVEPASAVRPRAPPAPARATPRVATAAAPRRTRRPRPRLRTRRSVGGTDSGMRELAGVRDMRVSLFMCGPRLPGGGCRGVGGVLDHSEVWPGMPTRSMTRND